MTTPRRALVSVHDKTELVEFARLLAELGFEIVSTGGTCRALRAAGVPALEISQLTGFPEILEGRLKTLHPLVHGAILGRPDHPGDAAQLREQGIVPFELVVCNLYPFAQTVARPGATFAEAIEQIDVGGPCMIRAAAKNHAYVGVVTSPAQYGRVADALRGGTLPPELRRELAAAAFEHTARYDRMIADWMARQIPCGTVETVFPERLELAPQAEQEGTPNPAPTGGVRLTLIRQEPLRYGENPHQRAAYYVEALPPPGTLGAARQLHGKELSYNNLLDLDAALRLARSFAEPFVAVIKHTNPCGAAVGRDAADAFRRAYAGDPVSAFGSIIGFNRTIDEASAMELTEPGRFVEAVLAPAFEPAALEILTTRPKWKQNVRLIECPALDRPYAAEAGDQEAGVWELRSVTGGLLIQEADLGPDDAAAWNVVTQRNPTEDERRDLAFGWQLAKQVKSNAIVFVRKGMLTGSGAGQMSRLDSVRIAAAKTRTFDENLATPASSRGGVVASDAFFPFPDGVEAAAAAGMTAVIQPGGSRNDAEVVAACDRLGLAMIFTGRRHFRH